MARRRLPRRPRVHWLFLAVTACTLTLALLAEGYAHHRLGATGTARPADDPVQVAELSGPVADFSVAPPRTVALPAGTVALTFDDGPDPEWTPQILDVLRREHVPATFFVVGSQVAAHPELARREVAEGHELGSHTFTHVNLGRMPGWRASLELSLTQLAIGGATGVHTGLFRAPYSSTPDAVTSSLAGAERAAARLGYLSVLSDRDGEDWRRPGVDRIVTNAMPEGGAGGIVLLHDSGGDRAQTVAALPLLIERLRAGGYRFTTVADAAGVLPGAVSAPVGGYQRQQGVALLAALRIAGIVNRLLLWLAVTVSILGVARTILLVAFARHHARGLAGPALGGFAPPVSIIVPAFNEAVGIEASILSLAASVYPDFEIIVVDDGSTDGTADIVRRLGVAQVTVVRQANAGKPAALNTGIAHARHDILVTVDGDTVFEPGTLAALVPQLADPTVGAVSGNTKVGNRSGLLGRWQHIEYVMGFNLDRRLFHLLNCMPTVPGAIGGFRREAIEAAGGVSGSTLAEDTDLTMAIIRSGWRVVYEEQARAWTEAPASLGALWRQRYRWCYGTMQSIWKHRRALRSSGHDRRLGRVGLPYLILFQVLLPLLGPVFDVYALYGLLFLNPLVVAAWWGGFTIVQLALASYAFHLDRERATPLWALPLQQLVYRQLMYLVVIQSAVSALAGTRLPWHKMTRTGDVTVLEAG